MKIVLTCAGIVLSILMVILFISTKNDMNKTRISIMKLSYEISKKNGYEHCKEKKDIYIQLEETGEFKWIKSFWENKRMPLYKEGELKFDIKEENFSEYIIEKGFFDGQKQCILSTPK